MHRVVLDTNTVISAFVFGGNPEEVYLSGVRGEITLITSPAVMREIGDVLQRKMGWDDTHTEQALKQIARVFEIVRPKKSLAIVDDEPDNRILEAAIAGKAQFIISGDRHLLDLKDFKGIGIMNSSRFIRDHIGP